MRARLGERAHQPVGQVLAAVEQALERDRLRDRAVVEEDRDLAARRQPYGIGHRRVDPPVDDVDPGPVVAGGLVVDPAHAPGLVRREDGEANPVLGQQIERLQVHCGLGQPHALGLAAEAMREVLDPPDYLGGPVAQAGQRHDQVVVRLGDRRAVAGVARPALAVGRQNGLVGFGLLCLQPRQQGRAKVKADLAVVVDDRDDPALAVQDAGCGVGRIALGGDPRVPVVVWVGRVLQLDRLEPRVFARRLVKMAVDADVAFHLNPLNVSMFERANVPTFERSNARRWSETRSPAGAASGSASTGASGMGWARPSRRHSCPGRCPSSPRRRC